MAKAMDEVAVTAQRRAVQEDLGDLKLYRVPMRVNVNANGQKQVALLEKPAVPFDLLYGATIWPEAVTEAAPLHMLVRMENKEKQGLGLPLPSGGIARSEEHTSELQSLMRISYAVFCLKKTKNIK